MHRLLQVIFKRRQRLGYNETANPTAINGNREVFSERFHHEPLSVNFVYSLSLLQEKSQNRAREYAHNRWQNCEILILRILLQ